ncbi:hypothetical protein RSAG8_12197, partial [Rhizoctonia solani AG-8 WAC10335]
ILLPFSKRLHFPSRSPFREDWSQYWDHARRRGSIYGQVTPTSPTTKRSTVSSAGVDWEKGEKGDKITPSPLPMSGRPITPGGTGPDGYRPARAPSAMDDQDPRATTPFQRASGMFKRASMRAPTVLPRDATITRVDLVASAERIFGRYLIPGADKEQCHQAVLAQVPDMFHGQKEYVFRAMEQDAFPRFLRAKAFGNLTPVSSLVRLCIGLLVLWIGLAVGFSLIFLDVAAEGLAPTFIATHNTNTMLTLTTLYHALISLIPSPISNECSGEFSDPTSAPDLSTLDDEALGELLVKETLKHIKITPYPWQVRVAVAMIQQQDVLSLAGTGKTLPFVMPLFLAKSRVIQEVGCNINGRGHEFEHRFLFLINVKPDNYKGSENGAKPRYGSSERGGCDETQMESIKHLY